MSYMIDDARFSEEKEGYVEYAHNSKDYYQACGVEKAHMKLLAAKLMWILEDRKCKSSVVEELEAMAEDNPLVHRLIYTALVDNVKDVVNSILRKDEIAKIIEAIRETKKEQQQGTACSAE